MKEHNNNLDEQNLDILKDIYKKTDDLMRHISLLYMDNETELQNISSFYHSSLKEKLENQNKNFSSIYKKMKKIKDETKLKIIKKLEENSCDKSDINESVLNNNLPNIKSGVSRWEE